MPIATISALGALVYVFVNFLKMVVNKDHNGALTQIIVWVSGIVAIILFAHSQFGSGINFGGVILKNTSWVDQLLLGLMASSLLSTFNNTLHAVDSHSTVLTPNLFPGLPAVSPQALLSARGPTVKMQEVQAVPPPPVV